MSPVFGSYAQISVNFRFSCSLIPGLLILSIVVMKLIAPNKDEIPDKCKAKIAKSTLGPLWLWIPDNGMAIKFLIKYLQIKLVVLYKYRLLIYILRLFMLVLYSKISFKPKGSKCFFCLISSATLAQVLKSSCLQPITLYLLKKGSIFS